MPTTQPHSEAIFRQLVNNAPDLIYRVALLPHPHFEFVNPAALPLTGYTPEQFYADRELGFTILHPDDRHLLVSAMNGDIPLTERFRLRLVRQDGQIVWVELHQFPIIANEQIVAVEGIARDITEQQNLVNALYEREQRFSSLVENARDFIVRFDTELRHLFVNRALVELTGISHQDYVGKTNQDLGMPPEQVAFWDSELQKVIATGRPNTFTFQFPAADGQPRHYEAHITPEFDEADQLISLLSVIRDITDRVIAEQQIQLQSEALNAAANSIVITDRNGLIEWVNPAFTDLTGYRVAEAIGKNPRELVKSGLHDNAFYATMWDTILSGQVWHGEMINRHKNGDLYHEEQTITPVLNQQGEITHFIAIKQNISQRKEVESALRQSQQLTQATIDSLSAHIAVVNEQGTIVAVNKSWRDFTEANGGLPDKTGVGTNYFTVCEQAAGAERDTALRFLAHMKAVVTGKRAGYSQEYPCHSPAGENRWFVAHVTPLPVNGTQQRWITIAHENVTAHTLAKRTVRESERLYRTLFENNPQPMWVYDLDTLAFLAVNDAAVAKYGYSREQFLKMTLQEIRPAEDVPRLLADLAQGRPMLQQAGEWRHKLRNGRIIDVEVASHTLTYEGHQAALVVAFDITDRKQAAADRLAQARLLQQILDTLPEGVILIDETGHITLANPRGEHYLRQITGLGTEQVLTRLDNRPLPLLLQQIARENSYTFTRQNSHYELRGQPIDAQNTVTGWVLLLRDVTKELEQQAYLQIQERLATIGQLAAGIAHDFNNVMAIIALYAQLVQQTPGLPAKSLTYLQTVEQQANHAAGIVTQILDFSRRSIMERGPLNLVPLLKELIKLLQNTLPETITIDFQIPAMEYFVYADPTRIQQALMNIAFNGRDAMPDGGTLTFVLDSLTVLPDHTAPLPDLTPGYWLQLAVTDSGAGIDPAHIDRIFDPFFTTKAPGKGAGLGLAQVHGIVKQHDGSIDVDSQRGHGTTFTIYLPLLDNPQANRQPSNLPEAAPRGRETILLVEDNAAMRRSVKDVLLNLGYQVIEAENGAVALAYLQSSQQPVALVISDLVMPEMGGLELHQTARQHWPDVKLLLMTGYPLTEDQAELQQRNWLQKPFDLHQLAIRVRQLLDE